MGMKGNERECKEMKGNERKRKLMKGDEIEWYIYLETPRSLLSSINWINWKVLL